MSFVSFDSSNPLFLQQLNRNFNAAQLPQTAPSAAPAAAPAPAAPAPVDQVQLSSEAPRTGPQNLMLFGGDRKLAVGTLIASGAKPENPEVGFFKNVLRKVVGGSKTVNKPISANQEITTKVNVKNWRLKDLRLTSEGKDGTLRHIDFNTTAPNGRRGEVKDVGQILAKGTPKRMFEQEVTPPGRGEPGRIENNYYDPKTGQKFMRTNEVAPSLSTDKFQQVRSKKSKNTYREISMLDQQGNVDQRYVFDYGAKSVRLETLNDQGQVTGTQRLSKKTDYWKTVDRLSLNPPSAQAAAAPPAPAAPAAPAAPQAPAVPGPVSDHSALLANFAGLAAEV